MKNVAATVFVCCFLGSSSAWAIDCQSAPGDPKTGWYSWREIDGRKCWFLKTGAMPPKSQLRWPAKAVQEARSPPSTARAEPVPSTARAEPAPSKERAEPAPSKARTEPAAMVPTPADTTNKPEPTATTSLQFRTARVKPAAVPSLRLNNGFDLINNGSLSTMQIFGASRQKPASAEPADPFAARFGQ